MDFNHLMKVFMLTALAPSPHCLKFVSSRTSNSDTAMHILVVGTPCLQQFPLIGYGGVEAHVEAIADGLNKARADFRVVVPERKIKKDYIFEVQEVPGGVIVDEQNHTQNFFFPNVKKYIEGMPRKPDIIWSFESGSLQNLVSLGIPMIVTYGDSQHTNKLKKYPHVLYRFVSENQHNHWKDRNSNQWMKSNASISEKPHTAMIWEGFPDDEFQLYDAQERLSLDGEGYVLMLGKGEHKGINEFQNIARMNPNIKFVNYGDSKRSHDNVQFRGELKRGQEHHDIIGKASFVFMFSTWEEAFGRVIVEALSKGTPILGSRHGSLPELIPEFAGVLSNDLQDLKQALRKKFNHKLIFDYSKRFSNSMEVEKLLSLSQKMVADPDLSFPKTG